ncbi:MAG: hypothetical protein LBT97_03230 [Planctomycetota bacterium]|nr:hypothetical protein [Planctomycetota bacterium]
MCDLFDLAYTQPHVAAAGVKGRVNGAVRRRVDTQCRLILRTCFFDYANCNRLTLMLADKVGRWSAVSGMDEEE